MKDDDDDGEDGNDTPPTSATSSTSSTPPSLSSSTTQPPNNEEQYNDDDYDYDYEQDPDCNNGKYSFIPKYVMPEALEGLNNLVKERAIKITVPERKKLIREIQNGRNIMILFTTDNVEDH